MRARGAVGVVGALLVLLCARAAVAADATTTTPIEHFIVLMQENHTFDNYFGTYPGADGTPPGTCMPVDPDDPGGRCVEPFRIGGRAVVDLGHSDGVFRAQYRRGLMDGFVSAHQERGAPGALAMGYYDDADLPFYWNVADEYALFDRFFTSAHGGSVWNHMYWVTGTPGNPEADAVPAEGFGALPTIFDRLQERGIPWKFYIENYDPRITFRNPGNGDRSSQIIWAPPLNYARFLDRPELASRIVSLDRYYEDLADGTLPAVAYIAPSGASEHPPGSVRSGERFVRTLVNALARSRYWSSSAFMWTYDDWGGFYDHVRPPQVDRFGYGFRAPALLVSPYARRGHVEHATLDFTSILKFIEENWGLAPLAARDARARSIAGAFDFSQRPRPPHLLADERGTEAPKTPRRGVIYLTYALAIAGSALVIGRAGGRLRRPPRRPLRPPEGPGR